MAAASRAEESFREADSRWERLGAYVSMSAILVGAVLLTGFALGGERAYVTGGARAPSWLLGPLRFTEMPGGRDAVFAAAILMLLGYLGLLRWASTASARVVLAAIATLHCWFIAGPLLFSGDVIFYSGLGRVWALDHLDPYLYGRFQGEQAVVLSEFTDTWGALPSTYGPLFILLSAGFAFLGVAGVVWAFKLLLGAAALLVLALTHATAVRAQRDPLRAVVLVGANPVWLAWVVGGAHNDTLVMAGLLASVLWVLGGASGRAGVVLAATAAVKLSVVPFGAFVVLAATRRLRLLLFAALSAALLVALGFALFESIWLEQWIVQTKDQALLPGPGPLTWLMEAAGQAHAPVPLGVRTAAQNVAVIATVALLVRAWRTGDWVTNAGWAAIAILCASSWLREWYLAWLLPLAALSPSARLRFAALALTTAMILMWDRWIVDLVDRLA